MKRRDFLNYATTLTTGTLFSSAMLNSFFISSAHGQEISIDSLRRLLHPDEALVIIPTDSQFKTYQTAFNKRTQLTPQVRVLCSNPTAVAICLQWAKDHQVPLALRCGGHSYEGFSQTAGLVIDTRFMKDVVIASSGDTVSVGGGANLGSIYSALAPLGLALPAGSCPTVGVSGHVTGGGYGLLARPFGLACDSLVEVELVTSTGEIVTANSSENSDLFWACRGGGGGSFGVITKMQFKTHRLKQVLVFSAGWKLKPEIAAIMMKTWQAWAPNSPAEITSLMKISKDIDGLIHVRCIGQSIGTTESLQQELKNLSAIAIPDSLTVNPFSLLDAIHHFAGSDTAELSVFMKSKSDYIQQVIPDEGLATFLKNIPATVLAVIFDSYGGAIRNLSNSETAFAHREGILSSLQYYSEWNNPATTPSRLIAIQTFYKTLRPYMSGAAYVNYCDLDLPNYAAAYWGSNLNQLQDVKAKWDPENRFRHAQSIPLKK